MNALDQNQTHQHQQQQEPALESDSSCAEQGSGAGEHYVGTGTYSPDDNKLRLDPFHRLDATTYARLKTAGFKWAPRQKIFVAPMWTPGRADLLAELCGEIGDDDTSLVDRAEERAERFDDYSDKRAKDADRAREGVAAITDHIPLGQPILLGHHSAKRAQRDADRIGAGMRRAVKMWETSNYWKARAAGALHHARYKELPAVRHRRIKGLEADKRKRERTRKDSTDAQALWSVANLDAVKATRLANFDHIGVKQPDGAPSRSLWSLLNEGKIAADDAARIATEHHARVIAYSTRWIDHIEHRISYERAMLGEAGGVASDRFDIAVGGTVLVRDEWLTVLRVNRSGGDVVSVTTNSRYVPCKGIEKVKDYRPPAEGAIEKVKAVTKLPPIVNFPSEGCREMTAAEWKRAPKDYKATRIARSTAEHGAYRYRTTFAVDGSYRVVSVFITDQKRSDPPAPAIDAAPAPTLEIEREAPRAIAPASRASAGDPDAKVFEQLRDQLRAGGPTVVVAPQLFPTPATIAAEMADLAELQPGMRVLEPSAGTGVLVDVVAAAEPGATIVAIEINTALADRLTQNGVDARAADFLECSSEELGKFDRVLMNPPFANALDIVHIEQAFSLLAEGGILVAICANGPRQNAKLRPLVDARAGEWRELPADTFKDAGTNVRTVLLTMRR